MKLQLSEFFIIFLLLLPYSEGKALLEGSARNTSPPGSASSTASYSLDELKGKFEILEDGNVCKDPWTPIITERECITAATSLNLNYGNSWYGPDDFPDCMLAHDGRDLVFFNLSPEASNYAANKQYAGICKTPSTRVPSPENVSTQNVRCSGINNGCCTTETPCAENDGDCDEDSDCIYGLICGNKNCAWGDNDDCCIPNIQGSVDRAKGDMSEAAWNELNSRPAEWFKNSYLYNSQLPTDAPLPRATRRPGSSDQGGGAAAPAAPKGVSSNRGGRCKGKKDGCCTRIKPCKLNDGDCDRNYHCMDDLVCGNDNCPWGGTNDCCSKCVCNGEKRNDSSGGKKCDARDDKGHWCFVLRSACSDSEELLVDGKTGYFISHRACGDCTEQKRCLLEEGVCTDTRQCKSGLKCGDNSRCATVYDLGGKSGAPTYISKRGCMKLAFILFSYNMALFVI